MVFCILIFKMSVWKIYRIRNSSFMYFSNQKVKTFTNVPICWPLKLDHIAGGKTKVLEIDFPRSRCTRHSLPLSLQDITHAQNDLQMTCLERFHAQAHPRNVKFRRTTTNPQQAACWQPLFYINTAASIYLAISFMTS